MLSRAELQERIRRKIEPGVVLSGCIQTVREYYRASGKREKAAKTIRVTEQQLTITQ